jgi:hypothetical protein
MSYSLDGGVGKRHSYSNIAPNSLSIRISARAESLSRQLAELMEARFGGKKNIQSGHEGSEETGDTSDEQISKPYYVRPYKKQPCLTH